MKILCTMPGKLGDILWALPTVRALSRHFGTPVDLMVSGKYGAIAYLFSSGGGADYISDVIIDKWWEVEERGVAPMSPLAPDLKDRMWDHEFHLGYRRWPTQPLPLFIHTQVCENYREDLKEGISLEEPWLHGGPGWGFDKGADILACFTDEHFELKYGLYRLLQQQRLSITKSFMPGSRWQKEGTEGFQILPLGKTGVGIGVDDRHGDSLSQLVWRMGTCKVVLACCSMAHVLAAALGKHVVVMEPSVARHNPIFRPTCSRIHWVLGNDGQPTFDSRHVADELRKFL